MTICPLATLYFDAEASNAESAAEPAVEGKTANYADLGLRFLPKPSAVESLGTLFMGVMTQICYTFQRQRVAVTKNANHTVYI